MDNLASYFEKEKTCYNCGNKNCSVYYLTIKKDCQRHFETYEYTDFDCVNHDKWKEMKVEEIRTDNTETLKNALGRIEKLENANLKALRKYELNVAKLEIEKLEKENAELRTKTTALENANRAMVKELDDMASVGVSVLENVVRSKEQLTKAKKIIKNLMVFAEIDSREYEKEYKEAEQFLKEVSE